MNAIAKNFLRYEPRFIEDCVFLAVRGHAEEKLYHRERNRVYEIAEAEERERAFHNLDTGWFKRLGLAESLEKAFGEQPLLSSSIGHCLVARAQGRKEEGAELYVAPKQAAAEGGTPTACILLQPQSLLDAASLLTFLRHELMHIADMLDPNFGYEPALPAGEGGPTHDRLLKDRYRVLWDATIDGRMARRGWATEGIRAERLEDFARAFPMLAALTEDSFGGFFDRDAHTHAELVAFVSDPRTGLGETASPGTRCALCGFPTYDFEPEPESLPKKIVAAIAADFPAWRPSRGLCAQCAELYRAREMSLLAARELPRAG